MILPLRKTYTHILCLGIACCTLSSAMAQKEDQTLKEKYQKEITSFFDQRLKDDTITFSTTIRMKWKETDDMKQAVWQLWKESNEAFKEEKLPALSPSQINRQAVGSCPRNWNHMPR